MNEKMFEMNKAMHQKYAPQMKRILKMLNCDVKNIEVLDEGDFVINFKKHNSSEVNDGNLKVVGKGFSKQPQFGFILLSSISCCYI